MASFTVDIDLQSDGYGPDDERLYITTDDDAEQNVSVSIDARAYEELGYPDRIKVTVSSADEDSESDDG